MPDYREKTFAVIRAERRRALQQVRNAERGLDTEIERMERGIYRMLSGKRVLTLTAAQSLSALYSRLGPKLNDLAKKIADFYIVVTGD